MWLAIFGMFLPTTVIGADPSGIAARSAIQDVALDPDGTLRGTVISADGNQSSYTPVQFHQQGRLVAQAVTDASGHFVARKLTGGVYTVQTPANVEHYRVWTNQAAPPSALGSLNISNNEIIRGQYDGVPHVDGPHYDYGHGRPKLLSRPWLLGLGVAAAIAIPLSVDSSDRRSGS